MSYGSTPPPPPPPPLPPPPAAGAPAPPNYLVWAIVSTVLCFWPVGIAAIVFSTQVNGKWARGDVVGAQAASRRAKSFSIATAVIGLVLIIGVVGSQLGS